MGEEKKAEMDRVTIKNDVLRKYFPKSYTPRQMEETILKLLEQWQKKRQRSQNADRLAKTTRTQHENLEVTPMATKKTAATITTRQIYDKVCAMEKMLKACLDGPPPGRGRNQALSGRRSSRSAPVCHSSGRLHPTSCPASMRPICSTGSRTSPL